MNAVPPLPRRFLSLLSLAVFGLLTAGGCARYEYDIVRPPDLAQRIDAKGWTSFDMDGLEYRLRTYDNRLVMLVYNDSDEPVRLLGEESVVIDPGGESHPIRGRTILPGTYAKLILPPPRPYVRDYGPRFGFGVGVGLSRHYHHHHHHFGFGVHDHLFDYGPRYYTVYEPADPTYWSWPGESSVTVILTYFRAEPGERDGEFFTHDFVFRRVKV